MVRHYSGSSLSEEHTKDIQEEAGVSRAPLGGSALLSHILKVGFVRLSAIQPCLC